MKNDSMSIKDAVQHGDSSTAASTSRLPPTGRTGYMVGLHEDLLAIKSRLCGQSPSLEVIPIVGMGGIGKTTLAKYAYDDPLIVEHFDIRAWVTVSQDYSADAILSGLLASIEEFYKERSVQSSELVDVKLLKILKSRRYLIVMDDIWSTDAWDAVYSILPCDGNGSRVMLTTRLTDVAAYADSLSPLHEVHLMDERQSWNLLQQKVFPHQDFPLKLEEIGKEIARSCKGLPLAIVVVAGILSAVSKDPTSWRQIAENVNSVAIKGQFEDILLLSYTHLPHDLRPCFLYMGMFPEDCEIRVSKLIKLWAAEGFLRRETGSISYEEQEEKAEECLDDLVRRNLVLVNSRKFDGRIKSCILHDLMRDLCIRKAHEEEFLANFSSRYATNFLSIKGRINRCRVSVTPSSLPHLSKIYEASINTILCFGEISVERLSNHFKLLRVLDAGEVYLTSLPADLFGLCDLVYLAVYYLGIIPAAASNLQNLQTLILHARNNWRLFRGQAVCLPQEIWRMPRLRHIVHYGRLPDPERISATSILENLQTLSMVSQVVCTETILRMIPNLRKLEIHCSGSPQVMNFSSTICYVVWHKENFSFPRTLKKLTLSRLPLPWDEMTVVGSLPNLRVLKLTHQACKGSTWETNEEEFPQLEFLLIENSNLQHWVTESSHFPRLKSLVVDECWQLIEIPEGIGETSTLELIEVKGKARKSLVELAKRILEEQRQSGNDAFQVRCITHK